jgi:cell division protein FtsX
MQDKNLKSVEAINKTKKLYKNHLMEVFGIMTVGGIIPLIGSSISASGLAMSVKQISEYSVAGKETPKTHILNYLGLLFVLGILLLISLALVAVVLLAK